MSRLVPTVAGPLAEIALRGAGLLGIVAAAALAAAALAALVYARERALPPALRVVLGGLRAVVLIVLLALLLEPVAVRARRVVVPASLLVLLDVSESMAIADPRTLPEDIRDAGLALGRLRFREPGIQADLHRASRALEESLDALGRGRAEPGVPIAAARDALEALEAALRSARRAGEAAGGSSREAASERSREAASERSREEAGERSREEAGERSREEASGAAGGARDGAAAEIALRLEPLVERVRALEAAADTRAIEAGAANEVRAILGEVGGLLAALRTGTEGPEGPADPAARPDADEPIAALRIDLARGILAHPDLGFLRDPGEAVRIRHFRFGETLRPAEGEGDADGGTLREVEPTEGATALGTAVEEAAARHAGQAIAGVVVLTDGASNLGVDPLDAARRLAERSVPIFPVGIGLPSPLDLSIRGAVVPEAALAGEPVRIGAQIAASGYRGREVAVVASLDGAEAARTSIVIDGPAATVELELTAPDRGGAATIEIAVTPLAGEVSTDNNRLSRRVEIIDEKIKVLYVEGRPRWEYRYLRAVLLRDPRLDVRFLLTEGDPDLPRTSPRHLARLPEDAADAARYDLVILGDVPARAFSAVQLAWIADLVRRHGGSFLLIAGDHAPSGYAGTPIADILPVSVSPSGLEPVEAAAHPVPTEAGISSGVLVLDERGGTDSLWSMVRPLHRLPRVEGTKPGAIVLATLSGSRPGEPYPLMAWQRAGTGKSLFVATDSLWRLRYGRGDVHHARFWGQVIRFLTVSRLLGQSRRVQIEVAPREPRAGERVDVHATVLDETFAPARLESFALEATAAHLAGPQAVRLDRVPGSPGLFRGAFVPDREGIFTLAAAGESRDLARPIEIAATAAGLETIEPSLQEELLRSMAGISGGRYLEAGDLPYLASVLPREPATRSVKEERELWDRWSVLALVLVAAGVEWLVRRRRDLP